ncbi:MAG TPA: branched-chain amino acid ABC transporter permease [Geminicoccaceae bacterium]|nr:branched-chain amino acid ABC transporter permease [Geminicoccus sp.]HMU50121.1 branched-chain amino acid ABC transporter permease [Geminicoccaceae bacterium]
MTAAPGGASDATAPLARAGSWRPWELAFWALALASCFLLPSKLLLLNDIAILALFALSLDLLLGYAGIVSLGHAAFFGFGAYAAGLFAIHVSPDPVPGLLASALAAGILGFATSFLVLRGSDLTRLMITLGVALMLYELANRVAWLTGGADGLTGMTVGPVLGLFEFDLWGRTAYLYSLAVLFLATLAARRLVRSPFGLSLRAIKGNPLRASSIGIQPERRLVAVYTVAAIYAGLAGALLAQTTQFVSLDVLAFHRSADGLLVLVLGGSGYLYGGLFGAVVFKVMHDWISALTPQYWLFWIGLFLVVVVMVGRDRLLGWPRALVARLGAARAP